ncbi:MAG: TetR/AcrR family transcriptional regulator [Eggerthellaceae bacterium]|nr:TetR/AcrR family transcriptional regulator [Eggerthellaceae bacterium]
MASTEKKLDRRVVRTRKAIMEAFETLLETHRLDKITVSAIAREADIDRKTFYLHYGSIGDLVSLKIGEGIDRIVAALKEQGAGKEPSELVHIALSEVNAIYTEHLSIYEKLASTVTVGMLLDQFNDIARFCLEYLGLDPDMVEDDELRMRAQFHLAGGLSLYATWLQSDHSTPIESVSDAIERAINAESIAVLDRALKSVAIV